MNADSHTRLGTRISHHGSADFQSAVSQGFQAASRSTRRTHAVSEGLPFGNRRHSRLETRATKSCHCAAHDPVRSALDRTIRIRSYPFLIKRQ